jgi:hypothetical protein
MRAFGLVVVAVTVTLAAAAADERFERSLQMLAPAERLEQLCDYTAMKRIRTEKKEFRPDRAVANAMAEPSAKGDTLAVTGGAFRSKKKMVRAELSLHGDARPPEDRDIQLQRRR